MTALLVVAGALVGAPLRYLVDVVVRWWLRADDDAFPWGTLAVNLVGSAVIGALAGSHRGAGAGSGAADGPGRHRVLRGAHHVLGVLVRDRPAGAGRSRAGRRSATPLGSLVAGVALCWAGYGVAVGLS